MRILTPERMNRWLALGVLAGLVIPTTPTVGALAQPARDPILRVETVMHATAVFGMAVDRAGKILVTASTDKTARVWDVATGNLLRVLRVPIGDGDEGKLYAAALSPDGQVIATGGHTEGTEGDAVYLFDRTSGRLLRRLTGLPDIVHHLAFSPDGARLAASHAAGGIRVWRTSDWTEAGRDEAYGSRSNWVDFDGAGRLVTSSTDGSIRLYSREIRLLINRKAPGAKEPFGVAFSPDGGRVAVGYLESPSVDVLSGKTLAPLYAPDTSFVSRGGMSRVAWSADGTMLYAGGAAQARNGARPIRRWSNGGRGRYVDAVAPGPFDDINYLAPLPSGGVAYAAGGPTLGIVDANHTPRRLQESRVPDYRNRVLLTDATGGVVTFNYELRDQSIATFRLADRTLLRGQITRGNSAPLAARCGWHERHRLVGDFHAAPEFDTAETRPIRAVAERRRRQGRCNCLTRR